MNQNLEILVGVRDSVLAQCGRWDQIRWQVPAWFTTLGAIGITAVNYLKNYPPWQPRFLLALGIFGALCFVLLCRLVSYERRVVGEFNRSVEGLDIDGGPAEILRIKQPFNLTWPAILLTATFWFIVYTALLNLFLLGWAARLWSQTKLWVIVLIFIAFAEFVVLWLTLFGKTAEPPPAPQPTTGGTPPLC